MLRLNTNYILPYIVVSLVIARGKTSLSGLKHMYNDFWARVSWTLMIIDNIHVHVGKWNGEENSQLIHAQHSIS